MSLPSIFRYSPQAAEVLWKEAQKTEETPSSGFLPIIAGTALGTATGYGVGKSIGYLLDDVSKRQTGNAIKMRNLVIPGALLGAMAGHAYSEHRKTELEELRRAASNYRNRRSGGTSGE